MDLTYHEAMAKLSLDTSLRGMKVGLSQITLALSLFADPHRHWPAIHIAGTNGKGSVAWKIAKAFQLSQIRCGLFTSPHLSSFRERIQVDFIPISEPECAHYLTLIAKELEKAHLELTFFEIATLLAFIYFREKKVEAAVIEVGLGGLLDTTNVVHTALSVITSISYDHTAILGATLEEIAEQKGGIIKEGIPVVLGPTAQLKPIIDIAEKKGCKWLAVKGNFSDYLAENEAVAKASLKILARSFPLDLRKITASLAALPPCRFEKVPIKMLLNSEYASFKESAVILDVAHNEEGIAQLLRRLQKDYCPPYHFLLHFSANKEIERGLTLLAPFAASMTVVDSRHPRLMAADRLCLMAQSLLGEASVQILKPKEALTFAFNNARTGGGAIVILGSFFIMQELRALLGYRDEEDPHPWQEKL